MTTYFESGDAWVDEECEVRFEADKIFVSYLGEDGIPVLYIGVQKGEGHFRLECKHIDGVASLHRFPEGQILDGWWKENGFQGMWRITLKK